MANMPITEFNSHTDGLDPESTEPRPFHNSHGSRERTSLGPTHRGYLVSALFLQRHQGGFSVVLRGLPGSVVGTHYHVGTVHGYTMRGYWRYLEHDWIAKPGTYIYELRPAKLTPWLLLKIHPGR